MKIYPYPTIVAEILNGIDNPWFTVDLPAVRGVAPNVITFLKQHLNGAVIVCDVEFYTLFNGFWSNADIIVIANDSVTPPAGTNVKGCVNAPTIAEALKIGMERAERFMVNKVHVIGPSALIAAVWPHAYDACIISFDRKVPFANLTEPFDLYKSSEWTANGAVAKQDSYPYEYNVTFVGRISPPEPLPE
jgi:hypothetical protein